MTRHHAHAQARRRRRGHQRLRRRARGRADLRLDLYEKAGAKKPVQRLWLSSMTQGGDRGRVRAPAPGEELRSLEEAARSRSEADWIVGMNATRAATIRLRSSFDGAVSLGRVQTPTLAIIARREEEIRAFRARAVLARRRDVRAASARDVRGRTLRGRFHAGAQPRAGDRRGGRGDRRRRPRRAPARSPSSRRRRARERAPLLYDLTSLQRDANTRFGFSARRTLAAAQRLYEEHKALTYPRTNSRFLPSDMIPRDQADRRARRRAAASTRRPRRTSPGSTCCRSAA